MKVPVYVDKHVDETIIRPIEHQVVEIEVPRHRDIYIDKVVTVERPVERAVYVDKVYDKIVEIANNIEVEKAIYIDKYVEKRVEVPYERHVDIQHDIEVEKEVLVDKVVESQQIFERIVKKQVHVPNYIHV